MGLNTSVYRNVDLDQTKRQIKAARGEVFGWSIFNDSSASLFVRFYDAPAASVTVGATVPKLTIGLEAGRCTDVEWTNPIEFASGITVACTTGATDADTGAPGDNECIFNCFYR